MRTLLTLFLLTMTSIGCQDMQKPVMRVISETVATEEPTTEPVETEPVETEYSQYDVNLDGVVDAADLDLVSAAFGETNPENLRLDVNSDGIVNTVDLVLVSGHVGEEAPSDEIEGEIVPIELESPPVVEPEPPPVVE